MKFTHLIIKYEFFSSTCISSSKIYSKNWKKLKAITFHIFAIIPLYKNNHYFFIEDLLRTNLYFLETRLKAAFLLINFIFKFFFFLILLFKVDTSIQQGNKHFFLQNWVPRLGPWFSFSNWKYFKILTSNDTFS